MLARCEYNDEGSCLNGESRILGATRCEKCTAPCLQGVSKAMKALIGMVNPESSEPRERCVPRQPPPACIHSEVSVSLSEFPVSLSEKASYHRTVVTLPPPAGNVATVRWTLTKCPSGTETREIGIQLSDLKALHHAGACGVWSQR